MYKKILLLITPLLFLGCFNGCGGCGGSGTSRSVAVSWTANRDATVNTTGGGYAVYYSTSQGFDTSSASSVDVPYVSGSLAPISATLKLASGTTWYIKVVAYGSSVTGTKIYSPASAEFKLQVGE